MILLMHPKYRDLIETARDSRGIGEFFKEARIPTGTRIVFDANLPEEDDEGNPIFAFKVSANETHYWTGEPLSRTFRNVGDGSSTPN